MADDARACPVCGAPPSGRAIRPVITDDLARAWELTPALREQFDRRESSDCPRCGNSARARILARGILRVFPFPNVRTLREWVAVASAAGLAAAEINACGGLHPTLARLRGLRYSAFVPAGERDPETGIPVRREDIERLSYPDASFDLVLHSETLEHVPDPARALAECRRVLKPGGACLFTIPLIPDRATRRCAEPADGQPRPLRTASFHGAERLPDCLVWWEFGGDCVGQFGLETVAADPADLCWCFAVRK